MTVIIPTCKRSNLEPCLESVRKYSSASIIVVANGFDDREWLEGTAVDYIWADEKMGYTKAILAGIKSTTDDVILLNDDVVILPQEKDKWINDMAQFDYAGAKMLICDVTGKQFLLFFCVLIKREVLNKVGLPDEIFNPGFGEDIDYAWRVEAAGYKQHLVPMNIYHEGGNTVWTLPTWNAIVERNKGILADKYANKPPILANADIDTGRFDRIKPLFLQQDNNVYQEIFVSQSYGFTPEEVKGKIVFDFGANVGMFSVYAVALGAREVVAVEAHPAIFQQMQENIREFPEIKSFHNAIFGADGQTVKISDNRTASTIALEGFEVKTITLEALMKAYPTEQDMCLKLDCEGAEYDVLFNTPRALFRRFSTIATEVHCEFNLNPEYRGIDKFNDKMVEMGYKKVQDGQVHWWDIILATGERTNYQTRPLWIQKWVRLDEADITPTSPKELVAPAVVRVPLTDTGTKKLTVTAVINTKGRYNSTLPMTIQSIIYQTRTPEKIVIYDDNDSPVDLRTMQIYQYLFQLMEEKGIEWFVLYGAKKGQHWNHQSSQSFKKQDLIWRLDDDEIAAPNVLEILLGNFKNNVGAVGGLVLMPNATRRQDCGNNPITDAKDNCQWYRWQGKKEVQHLYSSFLYRCGIVDYELSLSQAAHREETIFSHRLYRKGYKLIVDSTAVTHHLRNPEGGIRTSPVGDFQQDEHIFEEIRREWQGELVAFLDNGMGDHVVFKTLLPELHQRYSKITLACCYPALFEGENCISITEGSKLVTPDRYSIYKWMADRQWKNGLLEAFRGMYLNG